MLGKTVHPNCETPLIITGFPAEPWSIVSSLGFIFGAVLGLVILYKQGSRSSGAKALAVALFLAGCSSIMWHGTRVLDWLVADVSASLLCFVMLLVAWLNYIVAGRWKLSIIITLLIILGLVLIGVRVFPGWASGMLIAFMAVYAFALALRTWSIIVL